MERQTLIPGAFGSGISRRGGPAVVARFGGATIHMERADGIVISMSHGGGAPTIEIARIDDSVRIPHMVVVQAAAYFVSDSRRLYRFDLDRLSVNPGMRVDADKVLPLVALDGQAYLPHVSDSPEGYVTRISRIESEHVLGDGVEIEGELFAVKEEEGRLTAQGDRRRHDRPYGQSFRLSWSPAHGNMPVVVAESWLYGHPKQARLFAGTRAAAVPPVMRDGDELRPPRLPRDAAFASLANERREALAALELEISRTLPARYKDLYEQAFADSDLRWRLARIGLVLRHPMLRTRDFMARGLLPIADTDDDAVICLDANEDDPMPIVKLWARGDATEAAPSFAVFLTEFLDRKEGQWPTTVHEIRATLS